VVGAPDERLGEVPVAYVVGSASDDELERLCRDHLAPYRIPVAYHHIDALPRNEVGKILRRTLVNKNEEGGADGRADAGA
jgi:acyl-CoA synthetase (AMP-forming)/AMP-acid ligase II